MTGIRVAEEALDNCFLINLPVLKGHCQTRMSAALKNLKGLLSDPEKRRFHREGLHAPIAALNKAVRQDFILVDAICGDPDFEGGGHPCKRDLLYAAADPVLSDAFGAALLGISPEAVPYIGLCEASGAGCADLKNAFVRRLSPGIPADGSPGEEDIRKAPEAAGLFLSGKSSGHVASLQENVTEVDSCSACYEALLEALDQLLAEGIEPPEGERIAIGQGYRGKRGLTGIGNCTALFDFTVPGCPPAKETLYRALKEKWTAGRQS